MVEYAGAEGALTKDKIVIEPTSGNTGIGLAIVCAVKGYKLVLVMPETMTMERRKMLMIYGARIVLSSAAKGSCTQGGYTLRPKHGSHTTCRTREGKGGLQWSDGCDGPGRRREMPQHPTLRRRRVPRLHRQVQDQMCLLSRSSSSWNRSLGFSTNP